MTRCNHPPPSEWQMIGAQYVPPGDDPETEPEEWLVLRNCPDCCTTRSAQIRDGLDLSYYQGLLDEAVGRFDAPQGAVLYLRRGDDGGSARVACVRATGRDHSERDADLPDRIAALTGRTIERIRMRALLDRGAVRVARPAPLG